MDYGLEEIEIDNEKSLVAFLDILGFKNHVKSYFNPKCHVDKKILNMIKSAFEDAKNAPYLDFFKEIEHLEEMDLKIQYKQFSDCICVSIPNVKGNTRIAAMVLSSFVFLLRDLYFNMLKFNFYIRGGFSVGFHYEDDDVIFSEGLIKAYEIESEAIYPRIILDDELVKRFEEFWANQKNWISTLGVNKMLISDWDGSIFINPFNLSQALEKMFLEGYIGKTYFIDEKKDVKTQLIEIDSKAQLRVLNNLNNNIRELKSDETDDNVLKKYIWLKELVKWNMDPESSKIKFEYFLK